MMQLNHVSLRKVLQLKMFPGLSASPGMFIRVPKVLGGWVLLWVVL
jgi:hypothetical protein